MNEADILASTYEDLCTIYRPFKDTLPETGESVFLSGLNGKVIYSNVPCALSSPSGGKAKKTDTVVKSDVEYILFYCPDVNIQVGDTVLILHLGRKYQVLAGEAEYYKSHNQLSIRKEAIT